MARSLQFVRLAVIVAVLSRDGGLRGRLARRRRRGPEGLERQAVPGHATSPPEGPPGDRPGLRRVRVNASVTRCLLDPWPARPGALRAPL